MHPALRRYPGLHGAGRGHAPRRLPRTARSVLCDSDGNAGQAIDASLDLLRATGNGTEAPWAPIGIGVNTGEAFVGVVGTEDHVEFTAIGDNVNITARLASAAGAGEVLVTRAAADAAALADTGTTEQRTLDLRGRSEATDVFVLTLAGVAPR